MGELLDRSLATGSGSPGPPRVRRPWWTFHRQGQSSPAAPSVDGDRTWADGRGRVRPGRPVTSRGVLFDRREATRRSTRGSAGSVQPRAQRRQDGVQVTGKVVIDLGRVHDQ